MGSGRGNPQISHGTWGPFSICCDMARVSMGLFDQLRSLEKIGRSGPWEQGHTSGTASTNSN